MPLASKKLKLFSDNIVFLDTEFSTLDPYKGEIISIGIVKLNGEELYLELEYDGPYSNWVKNNILKGLSGSKVSRKKAIKKIKSFVGKKKPYAIGNVPQYDAVYMNKLFGVGKHPFHWLAIDFASILFANKTDPEDFLKKSFLKKLGIETKKFKHTHNALDDAKLLREVFVKFFNIK